MTDRDVPVSGFGTPIRAHRDGYVIALDPDEAAMLQRLLGELRQLLSNPEPSTSTVALTSRLFPVTHPDDPAMEVEYQRLMRDELVASRLAAIDQVEQTLSGDGQVDVSGLLAFMQSVNSLRIVLGAMLDITDNDDNDGDGPDGIHTGTQEQALYLHLDWLLGCAIDAQRT